MTGALVFCVDKAKGGLFFRVVDLSVSRAPIPVDETRAYSAGLTSLEACWGVEECVADKLTV